MPNIFVSTSDSQLIQEGELPSPVVLNRPYGALLNNELNLDTAIQYVSRSLALSPTENTVFLSHCDGLGQDVVSGTEPTIVGDTSDVFVYDGFFKGSAVVNGPTENLLNTSDSSLVTLNGWTVTGTSGVGAIQRLSADGLTFDNSSSLSVTPGNIVLTSYSFPLTTGPISQSLLLTTLDNLYRLGIVVTWGIQCFKANGSSSGSIVSEADLQKFSGVLKNENAVLPASTTTAKFVVTINYSNSSAKGAFTLKNAMVEASSISHTHTSGVRAKTSVSYPTLVDMSQDVSVIFWAKFTSTSIASQITNIGPAFLKSDAYSLGALHKKISGSAFTLNLQKYEYATTTPTDGTAFTLDSSNLDTYLPCMYRIHNGLCEFVIADTEYALHKSSVSTSDVTGILDLIVGDSLDGRTEPCNFPITEIRVDNEYLQDYEFLVLALARHPFVDSVNSGGSPYTEPNLNILLNPSGQLNLKYWSSYPSSGFTAFNADSVLGSGFNYSGTADATYYVTNRSFAVVALESVTFRSRIGASTEATGQYGVGFLFLDSEGAQISVANSRVAARFGADFDYYSVTVQAPSNAVSAIPYLFLDSGASASWIKWTRNKVEKSTVGTTYTDDSTPAIAVYSD